MASCSCSPGTTSFGFVTILTNCFLELTTEETKDGVNILNAIVRYHLTLGAVDHTNSYCLWYCWHHQIMKHTHTQFHLLFNLMIVNSWIIHKHINKSAITYHQFQRGLTNQLAKKGELVDI
jgi:uncharacterized protein (DUF983 family)